MESRRGPSSTSTTVSPLRPLTVNGTISSGMRPSSIAASASSWRAQRPAVEVGARQLELVADLGGLVEHLAAAERVGEAVVDHRVQRLGVAHPVAEARLRAAGTARRTSTPCRRRRRPRRRPARIAWSRITVARRPEAQTLLMVSEETSLGIPALICAWREGIWPWPAWRTWPITTWSTWSGATSARSSAAVMAVAPRSVASMEDRPPPSLPIGVRAVPRMTVLGMRSLGLWSRVRTVWEGNGNE